MTTPESAPSLFFSLADEISDVVVGSGYYSQSIGRDAATEAVCDLLKGPLDNMSVLVQIPKVRELVEAFTYADHTPLGNAWRDALEATS